MLPRLFCCCLLLTVCAVLSAPPTALASPAAKASESQARKAFDQGSRAYDQGHFDEALTHFERAYALGHDDKVLFNVARAADGANRRARAIEAYRQFLAAFPNAPQRGLILQRLEKLGSSTAEKSGEKPREKKKSSAPGKTREPEARDEPQAGTDPTREREPIAASVSDDARAEPRDEQMIEGILQVDEPRRDFEWPVLRELLVQREVLQTTSHDRTNLVVPGTLLAVGAIAGVGIPLLAAGLGREPQDGALLGAGAALTSVGLAIGIAGAVMLPMRKARKRSIETRIRQIDAELSVHGVRAAVVPLVPVRQGQALGLAANLTY